MENLIQPFLELHFTTWSY